ncbi:MAG: hypothetical protein HYX79_07790 [Chloroflexi bacterium]|nr:hypothetical protein [Chloroflexota bacterium]
MGVSFLIILFALAILVLAFVGVFGRFPDNWEWVGIVLAGWGIAMGAPSLFQMMIGRPKLLTSYERHVIERKRALLILLKNPPLGQRSIWRKLGVRRDTIESLIVSFGITEVGTGKVILLIANAKIYSDDDPTGIGRKRIALPPTISSEAAVTIALWDETKNKTVIAADTPIELPAGVYQLEVVFGVDGDLRKEFMKFVVGTAADDLVWL